MHLDYDANTTWTRDESIALWNLTQARPIFEDCLESADPEGDARRIDRFDRHINDTAYALGLAADNKRFTDFRLVAWYGEVGR
jgi:hypothetical protein